MRILIVEDEVSLAEAIGKMLEKDHKEQYFVDIVNDGLEGLEYATSTTAHYDLILLDIMLPKMDGIEVLKELRRRQISTPVMLLTARTETGDKIKGLDAGADDYLTKPFHREELLARVRALTRRKGEIPPNELEFSDIVLNQTTKELVCGENSVKLGQKEYKIMQKFMSSPRGAVIEAETFIEDVWGYESEAEYNNIQVYISFLRKKLQLINSKVSIKASRGQGYFLEG